MLSNHGLCGLPEEDAHRKSPKCLDGNLGDFGGFCKGLRRPFIMDKLKTYRYFQQVRTQIIDYV